MTFSSRADCRSFEPARRSEFVAPLRARRGRVGKQAGSAYGAERRSDGDRRTEHDAARRLSGDGRGRLPGASPRARAGAARTRGARLRPATRSGASGRNRLYGDIARSEDVRAACEGIDTVFHTAAVLNFKRFARFAERRLSEAVNVGGTQNVLREASAAGARRLVHTSTNNVAFDGRPVVDGDETYPYAEGARDLYTATKLRAEKCVLAANDEGGLLTCAIRPGGIFGPGEERILPALVEQCAKGRLVIVIGDGRAASDNPSSTIWWTDTSRPLAT